MSHNQKPPSVATEKDNHPPKSGAIGQSKVQPGKIENEAQADPHEKVIYVKVENPQLASKNQVVCNAPWGRFVHPKAERLCPRGSWKAICWFFFLASIVALIFFIMDMTRHN